MHSHCFTKPLFGDFLSQEIRSHHNRNHAVPTDNIYIFRSKRSGEQDFIRKKYAFYRINVKF
jgi:hypothetical protein